MISKNRPSMGERLGKGRAPFQRIAVAVWVSTLMWMFAST
jgi:hypothetical protein